MFAVCERITQKYPKLLHGVGSVAAIIGKMDYSWIFGILLVWKYEVLIFYPMQPRVIKLCDVVKSVFRTHNDK